ncbi:MAG: hypothetical protein ACKV19_10395 [Verrucomicrobiales bacterium]
MKSLLSTTSLALSAASVQGFPPAPYYTLHGIVRDQTGQVVRAENASVVLFKGAAEAGRATIRPLGDSGQNYELNVRIDHARPATTLYSPRAVAAQGQFSLMVEMGGRRYFPIEVTGSLTAGQGGEHVRLDLTLGEDLDNDGLPDPWEQWQLYQTGMYPDEDGKWPIDLLTRDGDFDGDGQSNYSEYLAGTFAGDATERFEVTIKSKAADSVRFEFFATTGKIYTLERSTDLRTWTKVPFSAGAAVPAPTTPLPDGEESFTAAAVGIIPAACRPGTDLNKELYRLTVR